MHEHNFLHYTDEFGDIWACTMCDKTIEKIPRLEKTCPNDLSILIREFLDDGLDLRSCPKCLEKFSVRERAFEGILYARN